jgi:hypothetical protein
MELVTMILACSLYTDNSITNAMLEVGSKNNPLTVTVDSDPTKTFSNADQAAQFATQQIQQGHNVNIGLMQIPNRWLTDYKTIPADLFLPCKNMVLATKILNDAETQCEQLPTTTPNSDTHTCALSIYKSGDAKAGIDYANTVIQYANANPFSAIQADAEAKNPAGFHMIPGDAPTTAATKNAASLNPSTDKVKKKAEEQTTTDNDSETNDDDNNDNADKSNTSS